MLIMIRTNLKILKLMKQKRIQLNFQQNKPDSLNYKGWTESKGKNLQQLGTGQRSNIESTRKRRNQQHCQKQQKTDAKGQQHKLVSP